MNMRLLGATTLKDIVPEMVDVGSIHQHVVAVPGDRLYDSNCEPFTHCRLAFLNQRANVDIFYRREYADRPITGAQGETIDNTFLARGKHRVEWLDGCLDLNAG